GSPPFEVKEFDLFLSAANACVKNSQLDQFICSYVVVGVPLCCQINARWARIAQLPEDSKPILECLRKLIEDEFAPHILSSRSSARTDIGALRSHPWQDPHRPCMAHALQRTGQ